MAGCIFMLLRSVLQSPLKNSLEGLMLSKRPKGAYNEVNGRVGTAVHIGQDHSNLVNVTRGMM